MKNVEPLEDPAKNVNDVLSMELVGPLTLSTNENKYILTLLDQFSCFCAVVLILDKSPHAILKHWFSLYRTDEKLEFRNSVIVSMMSALKERIKVYPI